MQSSSHDVGCSIHPSEPLQLVLADEADLFTLCNHDPILRSNEIPQSHRLEPVHQSLTAVGLFLAQRVPSYNICWLWLAPIPYKLAKSRVELASHVAPHSLQPPQDLQIH